MESIIVGLPAIFAAAAHVPVPAGALAFQIAFVGALFGAYASAGLAMLNGHSKGFSLFAARMSISFALGIIGLSVAVHYRHVDITEPFSVFFASSFSALFGLALEPVIKRKLKESLK